MSCFGKGIHALTLAFALVLIGAGGAMAQQIFGSIYGTVTDPSGSPVSNAKVTIADVTKGTSAVVVTDASGNYTKGQLIPDAYKVTIEAAGFSKAVSNEIQVQVDQASQFNAALTVGSVDTSVEVTATAPLLQSDRADVAETFTSKEISQLPTIGRNLQSFELLNPGTIKLPWQHASDENPQGSIQTVVNGQLFDSTGYYLDGTINQDPILGIIVINPTFDSVNEVKQADQDYDAEFGYTGAGVLTYSTKSGTNQFHGDAFESLELNTPGFQDFGRNPFNENTSAGVPTTHYNQYGGSLGGRVIKDKLFYFADAQLTRNYRGGSVLTSVPTAQERTGNLGDWLAQGSQYQLYYPNSGNLATGQGRTPIVGNVIPPSLLSPQALAILNYFPLPNTAASGSAPYNNYEGSGTNSIEGNQWNTRWDYYINEKNTIFGRYSYAGFTEQAPGAFGALAGGPAFGGGNYAGSSQTLNQSASAGWTYTFSPTTINEFRFGYMRYHITDVPNGYGQSPAAAAGIPGLNTDLTTSGLPAFNIQNPAGPSEELGYSLTVNQCNCPLTEFERQYQFVDNVTKVKGNHNFKFGIDGRYALNLRVPSDNHRAGELNFNDSVTGVVPASGGAPQDGLALGTFLLGDVTSFNRYVSSSLDAEERQKRVFYYGQDEWHVTPKLVFTYGVRWEWVYPETVNGAGNGAELNVATAQLDVFGLGNISSHGYQEMNWHDFAPRVGVAYQITPKTVVRAGYGWSYSLGTFGSTFGHNVTQNPPVLINQALGQQQSSGGCPTTFCDVFTLAQGAPAYNNTFVPTANGTIDLGPGGGLSLKTRPGIMTMPVVYAYNLTVQRQLTNKVSISAGYVGNQGRHTPLGTDQSYNENQEFFVPGGSGAYPFDGLLGPKLNYGWTYDIENYCNCANNQYNALQILGKINAAAGLTMQANYTYQYAKGDGWGGNEAYTFTYDRPLGYGNDDFTPHNQIVFAGNYDIPFGRGRKYGANINKAVDAVAGGWNISTITTYYSGIPFMPTIENYGANTQPYTGPNNRPNVGQGSPYASDQNRNQWITGLSSGAYTLPASNTFGNYPINTLIGPHFINEDASLSKSFAITERLSFKLRADSTNFFNHTNLGSPNADIQSSTVGQITSTAFGGGYQMRRLQFTGSFTF
ncbi:MAG: TonB-dependent receptor [Bryobacteraceae bacterium]